MDGRHDDTTLGDLHEKQRAIDGMINSLLNFVPVPLVNTEQQKRNSVGNISTRTTSSTASSSPSTQAKRGRGRPPRGSAAPTSPVLPGPAQNLPFDSIIGCIKELNDLNKKLLTYVEVLANKVETHTTT